MNTILVFAEWRERTTFATHTIRGRVLEEETSVEGKIYVNDETRQNLNIFCMLKNIALT